ncbi:MAG: PEP-CTERM sorting domain-containing protein [Phycisphaerae bacterium]
MRTFKAAAILAVLALVIGGAGLSSAHADPIMIVEYDFNNDDGSPNVTDSAVTASDFMPDGDDSADDSWFDGSRSGNHVAGEAALGGKATPDYYEFDLSGLLSSANPTLDSLVFNVILRRRHSSGFHEFAVESGDVDSPTCHSFDFWDADVDPMTTEETPDEAGISTVTIGQGAGVVDNAGDVGTIFVDLASLSTSDTHTLRIQQDSESFTAGGIDNVQVYVPEPATMALLGIGGLGVLLKRKR